MNLLEWIYKSLSDTCYCYPLAADWVRENEFVFVPCETNESKNRAEEIGASVSYAKPNPSSYELTIVNNQMPFKALQHLRNLVLNAALKAGLDRQGKIYVCTLTRNGQTIIRRDTIIIE